MPTASPLARSTTVKGSMWPAARWANRASILAAISSGDGTVVYQSFQSSPSFTASARAGASSGVSGRKLAWVPVRVTSSGQRSGVGPIQAALNGEYSSASQSISPCTARRSCSRNLATAFLRPGSVM